MTRTSDLIADLQRPAPAKTDGPIWAPTAPTGRYVPLEAPTAPTEKLAEPDQFTKAIADLRDFSKSAIGWLQKEAKFNAPSELVWGKPEAEKVTAREIEMIGQNFGTKFPQRAWQEEGFYDLYMKMRAFYQIAQQFTKDEVESDRAQPALRQIAPADRDLFLSVLRDVIATKTPSERGFWNKFDERLRRAVGRIFEMGDKLTRDLVPLQGEAATETGRFQEAAGRIRAAGDPLAGRNWIESGALGIASNIPNLTASAAAQLMTGGLLAPAAWWLGQTAPERYQQYVDAGFPENQARVAGVLAGAAESAIEMWVSPLRLILPRSVRQQATSAVRQSVRDQLKAAGKRGLATYGMEFAEEPAQDIVRIATGAGLQAINPEGRYDVPGEAIAAIKQLPETAVTVLGLVGPGQILATTADISDALVARDPQAATRVAELDKPSRTDFQKAGITQQLSAQQRADVAKETKAKLQQQESRDARGLREDEGPVQARRPERQAGEGEGRPDLEQPAPEQPSYPEAQVVVPEEQVAPSAEPAKFAPEDVFDMPAAMEAGAPAISAHKIIADIAKRFGVPIRTGHFRQKAAGIYKSVRGKVVPQIIRLAGDAAGSLVAVTHEVAHHIDRVAQPRKELTTEVRKELAELDYEPKKHRTVEGFAEFMRYLLTDDVARQKAPRFYDYFVKEWLPEHADIQRNLAEIKGAINQWRQQGAAARVHAAISRTGRPFAQTGLKDRFQRSVHKLVRWWADDQSAVLDLDRAADQIASLEPGEAAYPFIQVFTRASGAQARDAIDSGVWSLVTNERIAPGVREAFQKLGDITWKKFETWVDFLVATHATEVWATNRNPGISKVDAQYVFDLYKNEPGFIEAAQIFTAFHKGLVAMVSEAGRISPEATQLILQAFPAYVPLRRVMEERAKMARSGKRGVADPQNPVFRMKGSGRQLLDPILATMNMAEQMYMAAGATIVSRKIVDLAASREGLGYLVERIPAPLKVMRTDIEAIAKQLKSAGVELTDADMTAVVTITRATQFYKGSEPIISIYRNGKPEWYQLDLDLYAAVTNMGPHQLPLGLETTIPGRIALKATRLKRLGATELRAAFATLTNPLRDLITHPIRTEGFSPTAPLREIGAFTHQLQSVVSNLVGKPGDPVVELFKRHGGQMAGFVGQDMNRAYSTAREVWNSARGQEYRNLLRHPVAALREGLSTLEMSPRLAEVEMILARHGYTRERMEAGEMPPVWVTVEALFGGQKVTTNFKRAGMIGRIVNKLNAYTNAKVQDIVDDWRLFRKHPARTFVRGMSWLTMPSLLYWWLVKDEDWYQELEAWQRFTGWNFRVGDRTLWIPTPFLLAMVFAHLPVAAVDSAYRKNPKRINQWFEHLWREYNPFWDEIIPDVLEPALEVSINYSFFRESPIETERLLQKEPRDRWEHYTTEASKYFGYWLNVSPLKLDYLIHGYSGGLGTDILRIPEEGPTRALGYGRALKQWERGESIREFYTELRSVEQEYNSAREKGTLTGEVAARHRRFVHFAELMSSVRKQARRVEDKDERHAYQKRITGLARMALGKEPLELYPTEHEAFWRSMEERESR